MKKKILIVDDDHDILESIKDLLEMENYEVITTEKGEETVSIATRVKPLVILLDLLLSGQDGATICTALKATKETRRIPVIIMSAHPTAKMQAIAAGANDFVAKPFDADDLLGKITSLITNK